MALENLKTRFPKTYIAILKYHKNIDGFVDAGYPDTISKHQFLDILEFFDSVGIHAEIYHIIYTDEGLRFLINIEWGKHQQYCNEYEFDEQHTTRTAATEAAIEKCFEIREEQLEQENGKT